MSIPFKVLPSVEARTVIDAARKIPPPSVGMKTMSRAGENNAGFSTYATEWTAPRSRTARQSRAAYYTISSISCYRLFVEVVLRGINKKVGAYNQPLSYPLRNSSDLRSFLEGAGLSQVAKL